MTEEFISILDIAQILLMFLLLKLHLVNRSDKMDRDRIQYIRENYNKMNESEILQAISEISEELYRVTGDSSYQDVSKVSEILSICRNKDIDSESSIQIALNYLETGVD